MRTLGLLGFVVGMAACGGKPHSTVLANTSTAPGISLQPGAYPCGFVYMSTFFGPFRCTVDGQKIAKAEGEAFDGTLTPASNGGVHMEAKVRCDPSGGSGPECQSKFTVDFTKDPAGTFTGKIVFAGKPDDWWLGTSAFEIRNAGMGGDQYAAANNPPGY